MDKIQVEDLPQEREESPKTVVSGEPIEYMAIADRFDIDTPNKREEKMLTEIWAFARSMSETKDMSDIIWQVINIEGKLGAPKLGQSRLEKLYQYAKLRRQERQIQEELKNVVAGSSL